MPEPWRFKAVAAGAVPGPDTWSGLQGQLDGLTQDHSYFLAQWRLGGASGSLSPMQLSTPLALESAAVLSSPVPQPSPWAPSQLLVSRRVFAESTEGLCCHPPLLWASSPCTLPVMSHPQLCQVPTLPPSLLLKKKIILLICISFHNRNHTAYGVSQT